MLNLRVSPQTKEVVAVTTTVLRVNGASSWTGAGVNSANRRIVCLTNLDTANPAYFAFVAVGVTTVGAVSSTDYLFKLDPGASLLNHPIPAGFDLCVVRSSGSGNVRAQEFLVG